MRNDPSIVPIAVAVIAAFAAIAAPVVTVVVQRRVQRENRGDHFSVRAVLIKLVGDVAELRTDINDLKNHTKGHDHGP